MSRSSEQQRVGDIRYDSDFRRIEELIKGNTFSREEINHLLEILNSRASRECEKQTHDDGATDIALAPQTHETIITPIEEKQDGIENMVLSTPRGSRDVSVGVSASPIDIARAYMAGRISEGGRDLHGFASTAGKQVHQELARKDLLPPPSPKPSICWPGAMVHDRLGYVTPLSQKEGHRLNDFPRTPYSRSILPKSTTRLRADGEYTGPSSPFQQSSTSFSGRVRSTIDTVDVFGSAGPIRRIRNKFASEVRPRGSIFLGSPKNVHSNTVEPKAFGGFLPSTGKNIERGETSGGSKYLSGQMVSGSSDKSILNSNQSTSDAVRKILEHLDRNKPTPKEKEAELGLATSWRKSSPSQETDTDREENISTMHVDKLCSDKKNLSSHNFAMELDRSASKSNYMMNVHEKDTPEANNAVDGNSKAPGAILSGSNAISSAKPLPVFGSKWTSDTSTKNSHEIGSTNGQTQSNLQFFQPNQGKKKENSNIFSTQSGSELLKNNHGNKPSLPLISIRKPDFRAASANNGPGFTFPIFNSSGISSEPPTPSVAPSSSTSVQSQPMADPSVPSYSFGLNRSKPQLVFSFPSASNASTEDDSDLKFSFGSEKNNSRLSFGSFGKDGMCY